MNQKLTLSADAATVFSTIKYTVCESVNFFEERQTEFVSQKKSEKLSFMLSNKFPANVFSFVGQKPDLSFLANFLFS